MVPYTIRDIKTRMDDKLVYYENFGYDKNGNKIYDDQNGDIRKYTYDGLNRLTGAEIGNVRTEYEFDDYNNISREYEIIGARIEKKSYYYDNANRLLLEDGQRTVQYEYDNSGNLIKKITGIGSNAETSYYRYDGYNRLSEFIDDYSTAEYEYNINGLRESKTVNGTKTRYIYKGADIVGEIFDDNIYTYYRGIELIGYTNNKGDRYYYRQNSHGDVTALLTVDGQEKKTYSYNAYGKETPFSLAPMGSQTVVQLWKAETEQIHNPFRYCGEYYDQETGFIYLRNRYYDNSIGRFITEDPIRDGLNWYLYCGNNPVMFVDPLGESAAYVGGCALIGGFVGFLSQVTINIKNGDEWHNGVLSSTLGGAVSGAVYGLTLNSASAAYAGAATSSIVDAGFAIYNGEDVGKAVCDAAVSTVVDGSLSFVIDKGVGAFIKTNRGWIQPQTLTSFFTKSYGKKMMQQTVASGVINVATASFLKDGKPNVKMIQQLLGIKEDGIYGNQTKQGVKEIQQNLINGGYLPRGSDDGIWGKKTDAAFLEFLNDNVSFTSVK